MLALSLVIKYRQKLVHRLFQTTPRLGIQNCFLDVFFLICLRGDLKTRIFNLYYNGYFFGLMKASQTPRKHIRVKLLFFSGVIAVTIYINLSPSKFCCVNRVLIKLTYFHPFIINQSKFLIRIITENNCIFQGYHKAKRKRKLQKANRHVYSGHRWKPVLDKPW